MLEILGLLKSRLVGFGHPWTGRTVVTSSLANGTATPTQK